VNPTAISCYRSFRPPVADVWLHLTRPELLARWAGPAELQLVEGGEMSVTTWSGDCAIGRVLAAVPPVRLEMSWKAFGVGPESHVTLRLEGDEAGSRLTVLHDGLATDLERRHARLTWKEALFALRRAVNEGVDAHEWGDSIPVVVRADTPRAAADLWPLISTGPGLEKWVAHVERFDGELGGSFRFTSRYQGRDIIEEGRIEEMAPESRIALAWELAGGEWGASTRLELSLAPGETGTAVIIHHSGFDRIDPARRVAARRDYAAAWIEVASDLKRLVAPVAA
jgi:uncharacterized protein YndB with AHSA1/START domain